MTTWQCDGCGDLGSETEIVEHVKRSTNPACTGALRVNSDAWWSWVNGIHPNQYITVPPPPTVVLYIWADSSPA